MKIKRDLHLERMRFVCNRINEINDWRHEAMKGATSKTEVEAIDARVLELREAVERH